MVIKTKSNFLNWKVMAEFYVKGVKSKINTAAEYSAIRSLLNSCMPEHWEKDFTPEMVSMLIYDVLNEKLERRKKEGGQFSELSNIKLKRIEIFESEFISVYFERREK
jgi:hypothetical protein